MEAFKLELEEEERTYSHAVNMFNRFYGYSDAGLGCWRALGIPEQYFYGDDKKKTRTSCFCHHVAYYPWGDIHFARQGIPPNQIVSIPVEKLNQFSASAPIVITICITHFANMRYKNVLKFYRTHFPDLVEEFENQKIWLTGITNKKELRKLENNGWVKRRTINGKENLVFPLIPLEHRVNLTTALKGRIAAINKTMNFIIGYESAAENLTKQNNQN